MASEEQRVLEEWVASGEVTIDLAARRAYRHGLGVDLTEKECDLLADMLAGAEPETLVDRPWVDGEDNVDIVRRVTLMRVRRTLEHLDPGDGSAGDREPRRPTPVR